MDNMANDLVHLCLSFRGPWTLQMRTTHKVDGKDQLKSVLHHHLALHSLLWRHFVNWNKEARLQLDHQQWNSRKCSGWSGQNQKYNSFMSMSTYSPFTLKFRLQLRDSGAFGKDILLALSGTEGWTCITCKDLLVSWRFLRSLSFSLQFQVSPTSGSAQTGVLKFWEKW